MLCRRNFTQPPRRFEPADASAGSKASCLRCVAEVFNPALHGSLIAATGINTPVSWNYSCTASDVYKSMLEGCRWCSIIGNAVLTSIDLDYWMDDWDGLHSTDSEDEEMDDLDKSSASPCSETTDEDGTGFPGKPGFITIEALDCPAILSVSIEFVKWNDSPVINFVNVMVHLTHTSLEDSTLPVKTNDEAISIKLEVMSPDMPQVFPRGWGVVSAASDSWVTQAKAWVEKCRGHKTCNLTGSFHPSRLVDVSDPQHARLVTLKDAASAQPYVALSYVWGPTQTYILTKATNDQMFIELESARLPKTIADAILVAHQLGFAYLWVDALCIIQDSPEDKAKELPSMANIYRESSLTIIAASAAAASEGFLKDPEPTKFFVDPFQIELSTQGEHSVRLSFGYRETYKESVDPINSRSWTLQERVLPSSLLIFSNRGIIWMCKECHINPGAPPDAGPPLLTSLDPDTSDKEIDEERLREQWMAIRAEYTERDITYCSDKLLAISALAMEVSRRAGWTYLAGVWKEDLFSELHWKSMKTLKEEKIPLVKLPKVREAGYLAPSWSWASCGLGMVVDAEDERMDREVFHFKVLETNIETENDGGFVFGPVRSGFLLVEGKVVELNLRVEDSQDPAGSDALLFEVDGVNDGQAPYIVGDGCLDPLNENILPDTRVFCLGLSTVRLGRQRIVPVEGLILLRNDLNDSFHRIGFFRMTAPSVFDNVPLRVLKLK